MEVFAREVHHQISSGLATSMGEGHFVERLTVVVKESDVASAEYSDDIVKSVLCVFAVIDRWRFWQLGRGEACLSERVSHAALRCAEC